MFRVLLVDDNHIFREAFKGDFSLQYPSVFIEETAGGDEALQKVKGNQPHLIFMDIRRPGMNGLQLTQKIKGETPNIHIAILINYDLPGYREAALQQGSGHFFVKRSLQWHEVLAFSKSPHRAQTTEHIRLSALTTPAYSPSCG